MTTGRPDLHATSDFTADRRLGASTRLARHLLPRSLVGRTLVLAFVATHIPLLIVIGYLGFLAHLDRSDAIWLVLVTLGATLLGTGLMLGGLWVLLTPMVIAGRALANYRQSRTAPRFPSLPNDEGGVLLSAIGETIAELDAALARIRAEAARDTLTGVANRGEGQRRLTDALTRIDATRSSHTVIVLDVDGLKDINDHWGHPSGDSALQQVAAALVSAVGEEGWVARWGGDEFVIVGWPPPASSAEWEGRLRQALMSLTIEPAPGVRVALRASMGSTSTTGNEPMATVIARADADLYRSRRARNWIYPRHQVSIPDPDADQPEHGNVLTDMPDNDR